MELCYLHPHYFKPEESILDELNLTREEPYILIRFVSWDANHDFGQKGFTHEDKKLLISTLSKKIKIYISSEKNLPEEFRKFRVKVSPDKIHHVMAFATLFVGEGATMASECAMLGTASIYVNTITAGTLEEQEKYGSCLVFVTQREFLKK